MNLYYTICITCTWKKDLHPDWDLNPGPNGLQSSQRHASTAPPPPRVPILFMYHTIRLPSIQCGLYNLTRMAYSQPLFPATSTRPNRFAYGSSQKWCHFSETTRPRQNLGQNSRNFFLFWGYEIFSWCKKVRLCILSSVLGGFGMILVGRHPL